MTFCKTTHDLNNNIDVLDMDDLKDELIEERSNQFFDDLIKGKSVDVNGESWSFDDFISETEMPAELVSSLILGHKIRLQIYLTEELNTWCQCLAKEAIK